MTDHPERRDISPKGAAVRRLMGEEIKSGTFDQLGCGAYAVVASFGARAWEEGRLYGEGLARREAVAATKAPNEGGDDR